MNADGPRNSPACTPIQGIGDGSHSHHPRSVSIRVHPWFSLPHHAGERFLVAADSLRLPLWTAVKALGASPLWRGRWLDRGGWFPDTGAEPMRACGARLEAGKAGSAEFIPPRRPGKRRNEFRAPGGRLPPQGRAGFHGGSSFSKIPPNRKNLSPNRSNYNFNAIQAFIKTVQAPFKTIQSGIKAVWFGCRAIWFRGKGNLSCLKKYLFGFFLIWCSFHPFSRSIP